MGDVSLIKKGFINFCDNVIKNEKISHAYLFEISNYDTDMFYIFQFIKMILSNKSYDDVLNFKEDYFELIDNYDYPDIRVIEPDGNFIKKSQLVELKDDFSNKSLLNNKRFYIIKEAEKMNASSANTMLKFIEEPEDDIIAILVTDNRYHIIDTILSRCQIVSLQDSISINFDNVSFDDIELLKCFLNPKSFIIRYNYFVDQILVDKNVLKEKIKIVENLIFFYLYNSYCDNIYLGEIDINSLFCDTNSKYLLFVLSVIEDEILKLEYNVNYKLWIDSFFSKLIIGG